MRIPLTRYGLPQVVVFPALIIAVMIVCVAAGRLALPSWSLYLTEAVLVLILIWGVSFFRDPHRDIVADENILLAPADGRVTDVGIVADEGTLESCREPLLEEIIYGASHSRWGRTGKVKLDEVGT